MLNMHYSSGSGDSYKSVDENQIVSVEWKKATDNVKLSDGTTVTFSAEQVYSYARQGDKAYMDSHGQSKSADEIGKELGILPASMVSPDKLVGAKSGSVTILGQRLSGNKILTKVKIVRIGGYAITDVNLSLREGVTNLADRFVDLQSGDDIEIELQITIPTDKFIAGKVYKTAFIYKEEGVGKEIESGEVTIPNPVTIPPVGGGGSPLDSTAPINPPSTDTSASNPSGDSASTVR